MPKPLAIDLFCGLGGWAEGFLSEGYDVIGFDIERRPYPGQLVLQDILTLHGSQLRHAAAIVASPPCQNYSYMAMPWTRAKQIAGGLREEIPFPDGYTGARTVKALNALFDACFRIQREASEAAGRYIPMVVENVKGAQPWVGEAKAHFGSFYLWGDIESVGNAIVCGGVKFGNTLRAARRGSKVPGMDWSKFGQPGYKAEAFNGRLERERADSIKTGGGSWFNIAHNTESGVGNNPDGRKVSVYSDPRRNGGKGSHLTNPRENLERMGVKQHGSGPEWFDNGIAAHSSKSASRKDASALIAKIPFELARHIASVFKPQREEQNGVSQTA